LGTSPERKRKGFYARLGKLYLELPISYPGLLPDELVRLA